MTTPIDHCAELRVGVPAIDADHQALLDLCDQLLAGVRSGVALDGLEPLLAAMIGRARAHFDAEERILDRAGYPALASHKAEHRRLMVKAETLRAHWAEVDGERVGAVAEYMRTWLLDHIRTEDRSFRSFLMRLA